MIAKAGLFDGIISGLVCGEGTGKVKLYYQDSHVSIYNGDCCSMSEISEEYCKLAVERNKQQVMI